MAKPALSTIISGFVGSQPSMVSVDVPAATRGGASELPPKARHHRANKNLRAASETDRLG